MVAKMVAKVPQFPRIKIMWIKLCMAHQILQIKIIQTRIPEIIGTTLVLSFCKIDSSISLPLTHIKGA